MQQCRRRHTEGCPRRARKDSAESGQERAIGGLVGTTSHLAPKNSHFMAQGEEFGLLGAPAAKEQEDQLEQLMQAKVDEGP
jgi:hypothetical protein